MNNNKMKRFPTFKEVTRITTTDTDFIQFMERDSRKELLEAIISSNYCNDDNGYTNFLIETVIKNNLHHRLFEDKLTNDEMYPILLERYINEGNIKDWFDKKIETAKGWVEDKTEKAKEAGVKVIAKLKSFGDVVKIIKDSVAGFLKASWDFIKKSVTSGLSQYKDDILSKWKHWTEKDEEGVVGEIKSFQGMATATVTWATTGFPSEAGKAAQEVGSEDSETQDKEAKPKDKEAKESYNYVDVLEHSIYIALSELVKEDSNILDEAIEFNNTMNDPIKSSILEESCSLYINSLDESEGGHGHGDSHGIEIPFIGKVVHKLAHMKPFEYLSNIEKWVGDKVNNIFHKVSIWVNKFASGPAPFLYKYLGQCAGFAAGAKIKSGLAEIAKMIAKSSIGAAIATQVPGLGWILTMLKTVASGIWYVEVGQLAISAATDAGASATKKIKGSKDSGSEKPSDDSEEKAQEKPQEKN